MSNILRCKLEDCHVLEGLVAPSPGVSAGDMGLIEATVYAYLSDYATGESCVKIIEAERIVLPKEARVAFDVGDDVFYDNSTATLNATGVGRYWCGKCVEAADADDSTVLVDFSGNDAEVVS